MIQVPLRRVVAVGAPVRGSQLVWLLLIIVGFTALPGCRQLTDIDAPDVVSPGALDNPAGASARYAGALSDFAAAFADQVAETGLIADEFHDVGNSPASSDRRVIMPVNPYPFEGLSRARLSAYRAIATLRRFAPDQPDRIGELYALVGYVEIMFAENLCSPIPLATIVEGNPVSAPSLDRGALIAHALLVFDTASAEVGESATITNLIRVGRARALLLRGDISGAAAVVQEVPESFRYDVEYSAATAGQTNSVYDRVAMGRYISVSDIEGENGLPFITGSDARIGAYSLGLSRSGQPLYNYSSNSSLGATITLASGIEALLIRAESALGADSIATWAELLTDLRATGAASEIAPLTDDSTLSATPSLRVDVLFHERAFWLFGTGHRQGDLRRLIRDYDRDTEATFPTGPYPASPGTMYGPDVVFMPAGEDPNISYGGCTQNGA
jgi:hypothetical protein